MPDLIPPHGGLTEPVSLTVPADEVERFRAEAARLPKVPVSDADLSSVYRFGDGGLSPLTGPMDEATYHRVLDECVIDRGGERYAWTIPIAFPVTAELARKLARGQTVALANSAGAVVATLAISDVYPWDKTKYLKSVYGTERTDHPGADMVLKGDADNTHLLGGRLRVLPQPKHPEFGKYVLTPREVRRLLAAKGWTRVVAFQTRNPLHRAHEYALVYGLETLLRAGHDAGAGLTPLPGDLKITPVKVGFAAYYESVGRVDLMDNHPGEKPLTISGKQVREALLAGREVDARIMRPSTARILAAAMAGR